MSIIDDFKDINRRMNRKQEEKLALLDVPAGVNPVDWMKLDSAVRTLMALGYTYNDGCDRWKPPIGASPFNKKTPMQAQAQARGTLQQYSQQNSQYAAQLMQQRPND